MAVVYVEFERERARKARSANQARHARTAPARAGRRPRPFLAGGILAPRAGRAAPRLAGPWLGQPAGWLLAGAGLLACVLLLFRLAMLEADRAHYRD